MRRTLTCIFIFIFALCFSACDDDPSTVAACGDGFVDPGEDCDGDVGENTCVSLGHYNPLGTLSCRPDCTFDRTSCGGRCGDNLIAPDFDEACDDDNLNGNSCALLGYHGGTLACLSDCSGFDESGCEEAGRCGDGSHQAEFEDCEGSELDGATCQSLGYYLGTLACEADCTFDTSACSERCGDGFIQVGQGEDCDGSNLNGQTCDDFGFYDGALACDAECHVVTSGCFETCGDDLAQPEGGEDCDGNDLLERTCMDEGFYQGTLACDGQCSFDITGCSEYCGDGILQDAFGEACDTSEIGSARCMDQQKFFGTPACDDQCAVSVGTCHNTTLWGSTDLDSAEAVAIDAAGNIFIAGHTDDGIDGQVSAGNRDFFLSRFDPSGNKIWTRQWGSSAYDQCRDVALDALGNIYVTGRASASFDGQVQVGSEDVVLTKFDSDGNKLWSLQWGTVGNDDGLGVATDSLGNAYVTGLVHGSIDGQTPIGVNPNVFLSKINSSGVRLWSRQWGEANGIRVHLDSTNGIFVLGVASLPIDGQTPIGQADAFLTRFDTDGNRLWTRQWGSTLADYPMGMDVDTDGNIFISGYTYGSIDAQPNVANGDIFLTKYDHDGVYQWTRQWGTSTHDSGDRVVSDSNGAVYVTGSTRQSLDGQSHTGAADIFLTKLDTDGLKLWTRQWGTPQHEEGRGLAMDFFGNLYIAGPTQGQLEGQPNDPYGNAFLLFVFNSP